MGKRLVDKKRDEAFKRVIEGYFRVHQSKEGLELETWTQGGVNMIFFLEEDGKDSLLEKFEERVENFDVDEEIDVHRQDLSYRSAFTIEASLNDFKAFKTKIDEILSSVKNEVERESAVEDRQIVLSRDGNESGVVIGESDESCELEDCTGTVYLVEWPGSKVTECCSRGLNELPDGRWQIM